MTFDARAVANWFIERVAEDDKAFTPLQVIKLVYCSYGWTWAFFDRRLFRQPVEAWEHGPVIADVYHALKQYRADPIDHVIPGVKAPEFSEDDRAVLEEVYNAYGHISGIGLSTMTHHKGSPWDKTKRGAVIRDDVIAKHFSELRDEDARAS